MARLLSNLVDNRATGIDNIELLNVNMDMIIKNVKNKKLNTKIVSAIWNIQTLKMIFLIYKFSCCNRNFRKKR